MKKAKKKKKNSNNRTDANLDAKGKILVPQEIIKAVDDLLRLSALQGNMLKQIKNRLKQLKDK
ncbi:MAG TPA: hypothetical protein HPP87_10630 [Planctomycetes bacterium]|nr:hypothetical protein [Planctomycetota bacterium]